MSRTPLYTTLQGLRNTLRFDMPGHHGKPLPYAPADWSALDWTEHAATGDLFEGADAIEAAEQLWAERWGAEGCLFLTGGSTQGVHVALQLCCRPGDTILADRGSHRSLWNGLALLGVNPVFVTRPWDAERELTAPLSPTEVDALWTAHPEARALFVTSPTYYGIHSDLAALAEVAHRHGGRLVVDCAHGAHLPWIGQATPCQQGADVTIVSAHKTLPVPGQSALLLYRGLDPSQVRGVGSVYGSSSPSYVMMTAMDLVRDWLDSGDRYAAILGEHLPRLRRRLLAETPLRPVENDDPTRLVLSTRGTGLTGFAVLERLEQEGILIEMADLTHLVLITTCMDGQAELDRLLSALRQLPIGGDTLPTLPHPPELPRRRCSLRQAMFAPTELRSAESCVGAVAAQQLAPYPPGVPIVLPGEEISKKHLVYLEKILYNSTRLLIMAE